MVTATLVGLARLLSNGPVGYLETPSSSFCFPRLLILLVLCICFWGLRIYSSYWILWEILRISVLPANRAHKRFEAQELFDAADLRGSDIPSRSHELLTLSKDPEVSVINKIATEENDTNNGASEEEKALDSHNAPGGTSAVLSTSSSSPAEGLWGSSIPEAGTTMTTPDTRRFGLSTEEGMPRLYVQLPPGGGDLIPFKGIHDIYIHVGDSRYPRRCLFDSGSDVNVMSQDSQMELGFILDALDPSDIDSIHLPGKTIEILGKVKYVDWHHEEGAKTYTTEWFVVDTDQFDAVYGNPDMEKEQMLYMHRR